MVSIFSPVIDLGSMTGTQDLTAIADIRRGFQLVTQIRLIVLTDMNGMVEETVPALV